MIPASDVGETGGRVVGGVCGDSPKPGVPGVPGGEPLGAEGA